MSQPRVCHSADVGAISRCGCLQTSHLKYLCIRFYIRAYGSLQVSRKLFLLGEYLGAGLLGLAFLRILFGKFDMVHVIIRCVACGCDNSDVLMISPNSSAAQ